MLAYDENLLNWLTENPLFALFVIDNGKYIYANQQFADLLELPIVSIIGMRADLIINYVADPVQREQLIKRYETRLSTHLPENRIELRLKCPSGKEKWVELVVRNSTYGNEPVILGALIDITQQKISWEKLCDSEKKYRNIVDLLPQVVFEIDLNGNFTFVNKHGFQAFGYTQEDLDKGIDVSQVIIPEDREKARKSVGRVLAGEEANGVEYTAQRKDGSTFPIKTYSAPIIYRNKPVGLRGIAIDITDIRQREKLLREQKRQMQLLSERLTNIQENDRIYIARQLHDIVGQKLSLTKFNLEKELIDNPELSNSDLQKISSLISEVSDDIRHIISGLHPQTLKSYGLVQTISWYIEECCNNNNTECKLTTKGEIPRLSGQLELNIYRIFQEAVHNILKHARATIVNVFLEFQKDMLILKVSDNGRGFDKNSVTKHSRHNKFGINNMRERALMIGGTFNIESIIGEGTTIICKVSIDQENINGENKNISS